MFLLFDDFHKAGRVNYFRDEIRSNDKLFLMKLGTSLKFFQLFSKCESPIERLFLLELISSWGLEPEPTIPCDGGWADAFEGVDGNLLGARGYLGLFVRPQFKIDCDGRSYRLDFQVEYLNNFRKEPEVDYDTHYFDIEVDGHDFHEKTKWQAARDKQRDRALVKAGHRVLRFTGSEIYKNPGGVVDEISGVLKTL